MSDFWSIRRRISAAWASVCAERRSPPSGPGATEPTFRLSAAHRTALAALTPKRTAAARHDDPAVTAATTRSRKSTDSAFDISIAPLAEEQLNHLRAALWITSDSVRPETALALKLQALLLISGYKTFLENPNNCNTYRKILEHSPNLILNATNLYEDRLDYCNSKFSSKSYETDKAVSAAAASLGAAIIYLSTACVFDGYSEAPYLEYDNTNPSSGYGRTKKFGEIATISKNPKSIIIRTSFLFSENNSVFRIITNKNTSNEVAAEFTDSYIINPIYIGDMALLILGMINKISDSPDSRELFGVFHIAGKPWTTPFRFFSRANSVFLKKIRNNSIKLVSKSDVMHNPSVQEHLHGSHRLDCGWISCVYGVEQPNWQTSLDSCVETVILKNLRDGHLR